MITMADENRSKDAEGTMQTEPRQKPAAPTPLDHFANANTPDTKPGKTQTLVMRVLADAELGWREIAGAVGNVTRIASLGAGENLDVFSVNVNEHGNTYQITLNVKRL